MRTKRIIISIILLISLLPTPIHAEEFSLSNELPINGSVGECPSQIYLCITAYGSGSDILNLTFYSNLSGAWDYFYLGTINTTFTNVSNKQYCIYVPHFSILNRTYYWNVSITDGTQTYNSDVYHFSTTDDPDTCTSGGGGRNDAWVVGVAMMFSVFGIIAYMKLRRRENE